jgi:hypothetical protein
VSRGSTRAAEPYVQQFAPAHVEPSPDGLLAWKTLTVPPPSEDEERAMVQLLLRRGLRAAVVAEVRRLGMPVAEAVTGQGLPRQARQSGSAGESWATRPIEMPKPSL